MTKYMVTVWRTEYACAVIEVDAQSSKEAEGIAIAEAIDDTLNWSYDSVEHQAYATEKRNEKA